MDRDAFGRDNAFDVRAQSALKVSYFTLVCAPIDAVQYYTAYDHFRSGQKEHLWLLQQGKSVVCGDESVWQRQNVASLALFGSS
jgi:hypothetical protein